MEQVLSDHGGRGPEWGVGSGVGGRAANARVSGPGLPTGAVSKGDREGALGGRGRQADLISTSPIGKPWEEGLTSQWEEAHRGETRGARVDLAEAEEMQPPGLGEAGSCPKAPCRSCLSSWAVQLTHLGVRNMNTASLHTRESGTNVAVRISNL